MILLVVESMPFLIDDCLVQRRVKLRKQEEHMGTGYVWVECTLLKIDKTLGMVCMTCKTHKT